jgi:hypothetical protein
VKGVQRGTGHPIDTECSQASNTYVRAAHKHRHAHMCAEGFVEDRRVLGKGGLNGGKPGKWARSQSPAIHV